MKDQEYSIPVEKRLLVLVEGKEDLYTLSNHTGKRPGFEAIHFYPYAEAEWQQKRGDDALRYALQELRKQPNFIDSIRAVGVLCDADAVPPGKTTAKAATTAHVQSALRSVGWAAPAAPGQWIPNSSADMPSLKWVGFLVIPPNRDSGCLESMLWESLSDKVSNRKGCAEGMLKCVEPYYAKEFPGRVEQPNHENWRDKVRVHALLAGSEEPQTHTTNATLKGYWNFEAEGLAAVLAFLREGQRRSLES